VFTRRLGQVGEGLWNAAVALYLGAIGLILLLILLAFLYLGAMALLTR
jgi:hypothetical protein